MKLLGKRTARTAAITAGSTIITEFYGCLRNLVVVIQSEKIGVKLVSWLKRLEEPEQGINEAATAIINYILEQDGDSFVNRIRGFEAWRNELNGFLEKNAGITGKGEARKRNAIQMCERFKHEIESWRNNLPGAVKCIERIKSRTNTVISRFRSTKGYDGVDGTAFQSAVRSLVSSLDQIAETVNGFDYIDELKEDGYFTLAIKNKLQALMESPADTLDEQESSGSGEGGIEDGDEDLAEAPSGSSSEDDEEGGGDDEEDEEKDDGSDDEEENKPNSNDGDGLDDNAPDNTNENFDDFISAIGSECDNVRGKIIACMDKFEEQILKAFKNVRLFRQDIIPELNSVIGENVTGLNFEALFTTQTKSMKDSIDTIMNSLKDGLIKAGYIDDITPIINICQNDLNDKLGARSNYAIAYDKTLSAWKKQDESGKRTPIDYLITVTELYTSIKQLLDKMKKDLETNDTVKKQLKKKPKKEKNKENKKKKSKQK